MIKIEVRPRNWLMAAALVTLQEESSYCYEIMERLEECGFGINPGTLYRTLRQMEREGLCKF
jgi:PadR family transcriptional regulator PadR